MPRGAGVLFADARHDAAFGNQQHLAESEFFGAHQGCFDEVFSGGQASVDAEDGVFAEPLFEQGFVRLDQAEFPWKAGVAHGAEARRSGSAVPTRDLNDVGARFHDPRRDRSDVDAGHQFHDDRDGRFELFELEDELPEVFDAVDVVKRRRRDQVDAGLCEPGARDVRVDLGGHELAAFAGLCALGDLDFDLLPRDEVLGRHAKAGGRDLLRGRGRSIDEVIGIFAALTATASASDLAHCLDEVPLRFGADGAKGHGAGAEGSKDFSDRLDVLQVCRVRLLLESQQVSKAGRFGLLEFRPPRFVVTESVRGERFFDEFVELSAQGGGHPVPLAAGALVVLAQLIGVREALRGRRGVPGAVQDLFGQVFEPHAPEGGRRAGKEAVDHLLIEAHDAGELRTLVAADGANAHLAHDLQNAFVERSMKVVLALTHGEPGESLVVHDRGGLEEKIRAHRGGAECDEHRDVVSRSCIGCIEHHRGVESQPGCQECVFHGAEREQTRNGRPFPLGAAVGQNQNGTASFGRRYRPSLKLLERFFETLGAAHAGKRGVDLHAFEVPAFEAEGACLSNPFELFRSNDRRGQLDSRGDGDERLGLEDVRALPEIRGQVHDRSFPKVIDRGFVTWAKLWKK